MNNLELEKEYTLLFNGITDAIRELERLRHRLELMQVGAEEAYLKRCCDDGPPPADGENVVRVDSDSFSVVE